MKITIEGYTSDPNLYKLGNIAKFFLNGEEIKNVIEIDTDIGYIDIYAKYKNNLTVINDSLLKHRIFGKIEIFVPLGFEHDNT